MTDKRQRDRRSSPLAKSATTDRRALLREAARPGNRAPLHTTSVLHVAARSSRPAIESDAHPDVFVSYSREDIDGVGELVAHLRRLGVAVKWDQDFDAGEDFERTIRDTIDSVKAVIVVWSTASAASPYVRDEAKLAFAAGKLVPLCVPGFASARVPLGLGHLNVIDITDHGRVARSLAKHGIATEG